MKRFGAGNGTSLADSAALRVELEKAFAVLNAGLAPYETIKMFAVLPHDFTEAAGEMTPSLKVKRKVVIEKYGEVIQRLYQSDRVG